MQHDLLQQPTVAGAPAGRVELVRHAEHLDRVIRGGVLRARSGLEIMTADFKAASIPNAGKGASGGRRTRAPSIVHHLVRIASRGVDVRVLHAGTPSRFVRQELRALAPLPPTLQLRQCIRLHTKAVVVDAASMYLGSANLTGAGLGAKSPRNRNFEMGLWTTDPSLIDPVLEEFNQLWEGTLCNNCGRRDLCPDPLDS